MNEIKKSCMWFFLLLLLSTNTWALDKHPLLEQGKSAMDAGSWDAAADHFSTYIHQHPIVLESTDDEIRHLLGAYSKLLKILSRQKDHAVILPWMYHLKNNFQTAELLPKNLYRLGLIYFDYHYFSEATVQFKKILNIQRADYEADHIKAELRACGKLIEIYRSKGKTDQLEAMITQLKERYPNEDFDPHDLYKLALIYEKCGLEQEAKQAFTAIVDNDDYNPKSRFLKSRINSYAKLMVKSYQNDDVVALDDYQHRVMAYYPAERLPSKDAYKLAIILLKSDQQWQGIQYLSHIVEKHPKALESRKALFILARVAQMNEDWDDAIKHYSTYLQRHPRPLFFARKAYTGVIDAYWAKGVKLEFVKAESEKLAGIINDTEDFEPQLNLARDLKHRGLDDLAAATFAMGAANAEMYIIENQNSEKALRAHWLMARYADALQRYDIVEENCQKGMQLAGHLEQLPLKAQKRQKTKYMKSRIHLWLAKLYYDDGRHEDAESFFTDFLERYPDDTDADYARFTLGRVLEEAGKYDAALRAYKAVGKGKWKKKAKRKLKRLNRRGVE